MGIRTKTLVTVILVGVVIAAFTITTQNENLFKGQIFDNPDEESAEETLVTEETALPDLKPTLKITTSEDGEEIKVTATIENTGEGAIEGGQPFKYSISINDTEVLSNSDSYSALEPGDSFEFSYPISKSIYQYSDEGTVSLKLDTENTIDESDEGNNKAEEAYSLK